MNTMVRIGLTILIIAALAVVIVVFKDNGIVMIVAVVIAIALMAGVWMVKKMGDTSGLGSQNSPEAIDRNAKRLIAAINKNFNAMGIEEIGKTTQTIILKIVKAVNSEKFRNERHAVSALKRVPPSKFEEARDVKYIASTLAGYYVLASEETDLGFRTRQRIDNFIAGIDDQNL